MNQKKDMIINKIQEKIELAKVVLSFYPILERNHNIDTKKSRGSYPFYSTWEGKELKGILIDSKRIKVDEKNDMRSSEELYLTADGELIRFSTTVYFFDDSYGKFHTLSSVSKDQKTNLNELLTIFVNLNTAIMYGLKDEKAKKRLNEESLMMQQKLDSLKERSPEIFPLYEVTVSPNMISELMENE